MSGAISTTGRAIRRQICGKHNIEYGQTYDPGEAGIREAVWIGNCRECEADIRREQQAAEEIAALVAEVEAEAERRIAADSQFEERIRAAAAADLTQEILEEVARLCAERRPQWEAYYRDREWNRVVAEVEAERKDEILLQLKTKETG